MEMTRENQIAAIEAGIKRLDITQHALEKRAAVAVGTIRDLKRGRTTILRADKWQKISRVLEGSAGGKVPIVGEVGAGAKLFPFDDIPLMSNGLHEHEQAYMNCEFVDAPPGTYPTGVVAVRIRGDSMMPYMPDGTIVYYEQRIAGGCDDYLNRLCVVQVKDGPALLKILKRGHDYGKYSLLSYNADLIENVELSWSAKIIFIKPV